MSISRIIDRRLNGRHKSAVNRQRFMQRYKNQIQDAIRQSITGRSIKEVDDFGEKISLPTKDILEPNYHYGEGGSRNIILPGNKEFIRGDEIKKPAASDQKQGSDASNSGEGQDEFSFEISKEEFLELFFDDLALPDLIKTQITKLPHFTMIRAGYSVSGIPANINITRSLTGAIGRRIALKGPYAEKLFDLQAELDFLREKLNPENELQIEQLQAAIKDLEAQIEHIPFLDPMDIRYNRREKIESPSTQAVMFCIMDVSGSMDEQKKDIAKRFFILLYLFLNKNYQNIELVFIRHHTSAKEVDEQEFFYSRETGGTVVSSALELMHTILKTRYPVSDWNIYAAQASDGDNWNNDSPKCGEILVNDILPMVQYFAYIEIMPKHHQSLWEIYEQIHKQHPHFAIRSIETIKDIYPVFRELFKRSDSSKI